MVLLDLAACGGGAPPLAVSTEAGPSPFISLMHLHNGNFNELTRVEYTIAPKPGTVSRPVHVEYSLAALQARGYLPDQASLTVPVFGLYAGYQNQVSVQLIWRKQAPTALSVLIPTQAYTDPTGIYNSPDVMTARTAGSDLGFDFIFIKSGLGSPIIIDTDAQIRWAAPGIDGAISSALVGDEFVIGDGTQPLVHRMHLDGTLIQDSLPGGFSDFTHDINRGATGLLAEVDTESSVESNVIEMPRLGPGSLLNHWDLGAILSAYMASQGDDPSIFVRPGVDWFHANSAIYDSSDASIIVSSRENFVIKLDYRTGNIIWILGDPTKYWYTFPSLRAKALALAAGGLYPIGQHALSITSDGLLMLFNDGEGSANQPAGAPAGQTRTYSVVSAYSIDAATMSAREVWQYQGQPQMFSPFCSSAYEAAGQSLLVDYALADDQSTAVLVALNANHEPVFSVQYPAQGCNTSWNARPVPFSDLLIEE